MILFTALLLSRVISYTADFVPAVLLGRRILKVVVQVVSNECSIGSVQCEANAIGTKRGHRAKSGADEQLDNEEDGEEDEEDILTIDPLGYKRCRMAILH